MMTAGQRFRAAVAAEKPLQVVGAVTANAALLAEQSGFKALYLSGGGVAACSCGIPDLGITTRWAGARDPLAENAAFNITLNEAELAKLIAALQSGLSDNA